MKRKVHRIRLDPDIYQLFKLRCRHEKVRICEVLETWMKAYTRSPALLRVLQGLGGGGPEE